MARKQNITLWIILSLAILFVVYRTFIFSAMPPEPVPLSTYQHIQTLELADTAEKAATGLMWRKDLCDQCGMLFIFNPPSIIHMWMKNTPTALDMIFMDANGRIVAIFEHTVPFQEHPMYTVPQKVMYVLEMKAGFVDREQLKTDMQFDMEKLKSIVKR